MTTTTHFDPYGNNGRGEHGYLATTATGIARFAATPEAAEAKALAQEAAYREAGVLDEVIASLSA